MGSTKGAFYFPYQGRMPPQSPPYTILYNPKHKVEGLPILWRFFFKVSKGQRGAMREEYSTSTYVGLLLGFNGGVNTYPQLDITPPGTQVVMKLYLIVDEGGDSSLQQLPAIRYDEKPSLINLPQVVATNIGVCVPLQSIDGICFVYHGEEVEANPPPILKDLKN